MGEEYAQQNLIKVLIIKQEINWVSFSKTFKTKWHLVYFEVKKKETKEREFWDFALVPTLDLKLNTRTNFQNVN